MKWMFLLLSAALMAAPGTEQRQEFKASNGLRVMLLERHERPVLRLHLLAGWNRADLTERQADLAVRFPALLGRCGAGGFSRPVLDRRLADRGIKLHLEGSVGALAWSLLSDIQDQEDAFEVLAHMVARPSLVEESGIPALRGAPEQFPVARFRASLGFPEADLPLTEFGIDERYALSRRLIHPEHSILVIQGDLNLAQARQLVALNFGTWSPSTENPPLVQQSSVPRKDHPSSSGGAWAGSPAPGGDAKARAPQVGVAYLLARHLQKIEGGPITFETLEVGGEPGPILFSMPAGAPNPKLALRAFLEGICNRGFLAQELVHFQRAWRAGQVALALHPEDQLSFLATKALKGDLEPHIETLTLEDLNAALRSRLAPGTLRWLDEPSSK